MVLLKANVSMSKLDNAIEIAKKHHEGQKRHEGGDYVGHCLNVMNTLKECGFDDEDLFVAAVLHDICEDTAVDNLEISRVFGERVGFVINALSKNKKSDNGGSKSDEFVQTKGSEKEFNYRFWMYVNRFASGIKEDPYILFVKMSDQIDNLRTLEVFNLDKQLRKIREIEEFFLPIYEKYSHELDEVYQKPFLSLKKQLVDTLESKK